SRSSTTVTSQPTDFNSRATAEPTRPEPITITFISSQRSRGSGRGKLFVEDPLGESDDQDLAGGAAEDVVDGRREEARLPPPAGRGAEHDQVGVGLAGVLDDRAADRPRAQDRADHLDAQLVTEQLRLGDRR